MEGERGRVGGRVEDVGVRGFAPDVGAGGCGDGGGVGGGGHGWCWGVGGVVDVLIGLEWIEGELDQELCFGGIVVVLYLGA